jgi:hypothetical protein
LRKLAQVLMETGQEVLDVDMANRAAGVVRALMKSWAETLPRCPEEVETVHSVIALMEAAGVDTQKQLTSETSRLSSLCSLKTALENYQALGVTTGQRAQADPHGQAAKNLLRQVKGTANHPGSCHEELVAQAEAECLEASKCHLAEAVKGVRVCVETAVLWSGGGTNGARWDSTLDPEASLEAVLTAAQTTLLPRTDYGSVADALEAKMDLAKVVCATWDVPEPDDMVLARSTLRALRQSSAEGMLATLFRSPDACDARALRSKVGAVREAYKKSGGLWTDLNPVLRARATDALRLR